VSLWAGQVAGLITDLAAQDVPVGEAVERLATAIAARVGCEADDVCLDVRWTRQADSPLSFHTIISVDVVEVVTNGDTAGVFADCEFGPVGGLVPMLDRFAAEVRAARK
jgi:hypothetical protein